MKLLVTGGAGFVMSCLVRRYLESDPGVTAVLVDRAPLDPVSRRYFEPVRDRLEVVQGDVLDPRLWAGLGAHADVRYVVHGAAVTSINRLMHARGRGEPGLAGARAAFEANIMGTFDVLAWAAHLPALDRFITVSSGAVYADDGPEPLPEDGYVAPAEAYPITKRVGELLTGLAVREAGLPAISVRLSGVFGPMDRVTAVRDVRCAPYVIVHRALGSRLVRVNALEAVGDFIHAEDVADALLTLLALGCPAFPVYNIAYGTTVSVADLLAWTAEKVPGLRHAVTDAATADVVLDPALRRARWGAYDIARITAETGWRPRPMREALHSYVDWVRENE